MSRRRLLLVPAVLAASLVVPAIGHAEVTATVYDANTFERMFYSRFVIALDAPAPAGASISWAVDPATVRPSFRFLGPTSGRFTVEEGATETVLFLPFDDDNVYEGAEQYTVRFSATGLRVTGQRPGTQFAYGVVNDDDPFPKVQPSTGTRYVTEGSSLTVPIRTSNPSLFPITMRVRTAPGTAYPLKDYTHVDETVEIPPYATSASVTVATVDNTNAEPSETFRLYATDLLRAQWAQPWEQPVVVLDDDAVDPT